MTGKYYSDCEVGDVYSSPWQYVSESTLRRYLDLAGIHEHLFDDKEYLETETEFDGWLIPGFLTLTLALGLFNRSGWLKDTGLAMLGANDIEFEEPVFVGDELQVDFEVIEKIPTSSDRGGILRFEWRIGTRSNDVVMRLTSKHFVKKKDAPDA